jgi:hypothetical protein
VVTEDGVELPDELDWLELSLAVELSLVVELSLAVEALEPVPLVPLAAALVLVELSPGSWPSASWT